MGMVSQAICSLYSSCTKVSVLQLMLLNLCPVSRNVAILDLKEGKVKSLSCVQLSATPWLWPARLLCPWDFPGKNTGVGCHTLLQGIFPTQEKIHFR